MAISSQSAHRSSGEKKSNGSLLESLSPLLVLTSVFFLNFTSRISPAPLVPSIEKDLNLSHAGSGALFLFISLGYFITLMGSGFLSSRLSHRRTIVSSNTALGIALIGTAFCIGPWTIRLGLFAVGMAAGLYLPSAIATLTALIPARNWGKAIAIHELAPNISFIATPLICEAILAYFSWRTFFLLMGVVALIMSPVFVRCSRGGNFKGAAPSLSAFGQLAGSLSVWAMALLFSLGVIATLGIYTMLPLFLVHDHGMDRNLANTLIALSRIPCLIMAFVAGWATDRMGSGQTLKIVLLITGLLTFILGIASGAVIPYIVFLQPLIAACFFPAGFAAMALIVSPRLRNLAVSLIIPLALVTGGGLAPVFIGYIGDTRSFGLGFMICGGLIMLGCFFVRWLKFNEP